MKRNFKQPTIQEMSDSQLWAQIDYCNGTTKNIPNQLRKGERTLEDSLAFLRASLEKTLASVIELQERTKTKE